MRIHKRLTKKERMIWEYVRDNHEKYPHGIYAEQIPEILGWDMTVRYPDRRYRLPAYSFMERLVKKGIIKRVYDFSTQKHLGYAPNWEHVTQIRY